MSALLLSLLLTQAPPPVLRHVTKVVTKSWEPLDLRAIETIAEERVVSVLATPKVLKLERSGYAELGAGDYTLTIDGRFIEEAEQFSIYLGFGPGKRTDLPSFHVSSTDSLGGLPRATMQQKIERLAESAARRLLSVLAPRLEALARTGSLPPIDDTELPWTWGPIEVPTPKAPTRDMIALLTVRNEDHLRAQALEALRGHVFDQESARDTVVLCALRDPSPALRADCVRTLAPVARVHIPTQRVLLRAMRTDVDETVLSELAALSSTFVGLSRKESLETWLELAASDATPAAAANQIAQLLGEEGEIANLDLAVARCLAQEALAYGKRQACAQWLLGKIPADRRRTVVTRYLEQVRIFEQGETNVFSEVKDHLTRSPARIDGATAELFLRVAERASAGLARDDALYVAMEHPEPAPEFAARILRLAQEPRLTAAALRALRELAAQAPALKPSLLLGVEALRDGPPWLKPKFSSDPNREIAETLAALSRP